MLSDKGDMVFLCADMSFQPDFAKRGFGNTGNFQPLIAKREFVCERIS